MTHTPAEVIDNLGELQPEEIAQLFRNLGVRGVQGESFQCPVANYVRQETERIVSVWAEWGELGVEGLHVTPDTVFGFAREFDIGHYPGLIGGDFDPNLTED